MPTYFIISLSASGLVATDTVTQVPMIMSLPTTNDIGSAYVVGDGVTNGVIQRFKIP